MIRSILEILLLLERESVEINRASAQLRLTKARCTRNNSGLWQRAAGLAVLAFSVTCYSVTMARKPHMLAYAPKQIGD